MNRESYTVVFFPHGVVSQAQHLLCLLRESRPGWGQSHCGNWLTLALSHRPQPAHGAHCHRCPSVRGRRRDGRDGRQPCSSLASLCANRSPPPRRALWVHFRTPAFPDPSACFLPRSQQLPTDKSKRGSFLPASAEYTSFRQIMYLSELKIQWNII